MAGNVARLLWAAAQFQGAAFPMAAQRYSMPLSLRERETIKREADRIRKQRKRPPNSEAITTAVERFLRETDGAKAGLLVPPSGGKTRNVNWSIPPDLRRRLDEINETRGFTIIDIVRAALALLASNQLPNGS